MDAARSGEIHGVQRIDRDQDGFARALKITAARRTMARPRWVPSICLQWAKNNTGQISGRPHRATAQRVKVRRFSPQLSLDAAQSAAGEPAAARCERPDLRGGNVEPAKFRTQTSNYHTICHSGPLAPPMAAAPTIVAPFIRNPMAWPFVVFSQTRSILASPFKSSMCFTSNCDPLLPPIE